MIEEPLTIPAALDGDRVDRAVAFLTGWPRAAVQQLIDAGGVLVDGRVVAKSHRLQEGSVLEVLEEPPLESDFRPEPEPDVAVDARFVDDDVVVVAKPAGLVVHPGAGHASGTLVNGLLARFPGIESIGDPLRPGIVHRLDRDTSGLLAVARSARAYESLVAQLAARSVERVYRALVWGHLSSPRGLIDAPIGRSGARRTRMAVRSAGKQARTEYKVVDTFDLPVCSVLECKLETGRTHQIRVHLAAIGHPVVGDGTYGGSRDQIPLGRPFLHAGTLGFDHPATGERVRLEEPLPAELQVVLDRLAEQRR
ncbi:MAG TPA: RluA family pseudouridine synthase [Acidimicrobiia bacterium]|jgi:23S rRNA pseudouridine1911/1915/1917 synthase|nr:RluA family pseudouridine synthase [Acidimicrobiia bacterium]